MSEAMIRGMGNERRMEHCTICDRMAEYPCSRRQIMTVQFKPENLHTLEAACKALGWTCRFDELKTGRCINGRMVATGRTVSAAIIETETGHSIKINLATGTVQVQEWQSEQVKALKRSYAFETVKAMSKAKGWMMHAASVAGKIVGTIGKGW